MRSRRRSNWSRQHKKTLVCNVIQAKKISPIRKVNVNIQLQGSLKDICERVSFDGVERKLNSHDIAAMPALIKPFLGNTLADAVVQPQTEVELVNLVKWANEFGVPLIPRGKATSGYG